MVQTTRTQPTYSASTIDATHGEAYKRLIILGVEKHLRKMVEPHSDHEGATTPDKVEQQRGSQGTTRRRALV